MRNIVIVGGGAAGTMAAVSLRRELSEEDFRIIVIDRDEKHHYQPGYLFIPFGIYGRNDVLKSKKGFMPPGVDFVLDTVTAIEPDTRKVRTRLGAYDYDWLVIATGVRTRPEEVQGMAEGWRTDVFDFYSLGGALALRDKLKYFTSGRIVVNIAELPFKCPIAPMEFCFLADAYFQAMGVRDQVEIKLVSPLSGFFTKPVAAERLGAVGRSKNILFTGDFAIDAVDLANRQIVSADGRTEGFDLLVAIPPNFGDQAIADSGMGDPMAYMETDNHTLKAEKHERIYVMGDAANTPNSKAGSAAHYQCATVVENIVREIDGQPPRATYDGHATCFLASGMEKGILLDFNYDVEPLPGMFPFPGLGPFALLKESLANYWGKMMFRWVYWNLMLKGDELPLENQFNLAGKTRQVAAGKTRQVAAGKTRQVAAGKIRRTG